jgi:serine/threonine protein kinase
MPKTRKHHSSRNKTSSPAKRRTLKCDFNLDKILKGRKLGEGGFGAAYVYDRAINDAKSSARYLILNKKKQYVVKVVNPNEQGVVERKYIDRAKNEADILRYLNRAGCHKSILCYKGCSERADNFYIVTKYNPGYVTLQDYIFPDDADSVDYFKQEQSFFSRLKKLWYTPETVRRSIMRNLCEGLAEIHRRNVVHKDVKPQNILVKPGNGRVKYIDFGLSCIMDDKLECMYGETPLYIPPDFLGIRDPEFKHYLYYDFWVLGVCLFFVYFRENASAIRVMYKYLDIDGEKKRLVAFEKYVYQKGDPEIRRLFAEVDDYCAKIGCFLVSDLVKPYTHFSPK